MSKATTDSPEKRIKACYVVWQHMVVNGVCTNCGWKEQK